MSSVVKYSGNSNNNSNIIQTGNANDDNNSSSSRAKLGTNDQGQKENDTCDASTYLVVISVCCIVCLLLFIFIFIQRFQTRNFKRAKLKKSKNSSQKRTSVQNVDSGPNNEVTNPYYYSQINDGQNEDFSPTPFIENNPMENEVNYEITNPYYETEDTTVEFH